MDAFQQYQRTAKAHGLWFTIEVNTTQGALLPQLHAAIVAHFHAQGLTLPPGYRQEDTEDFGTLPWQLIKMRKRKMIDSYTVNREASLHAANITLHALKSLPACCSPGSEPVSNWMIISSCQLYLCPQMLTLRRPPLWRRHWPHRLPWASHSPRAGFTGPGPSMLW